ncbi:MAG: hypothetical protein FJ404_09730 [Verrucomicrobia bacterium]|nr:hypothetical protein [Verrucomicrobiota bacterium]
MRQYLLRSLLIVLLAGGFGFGIEAAVYKEVGGVVVVEAEHFDKRNNSDDDHVWKIIPDEDPGHAYRNARGGKYMEVTPDSGQNRNNADAKDAGPTMDYKVKISVPGQYRMWLRTIGFDGASDSMYVSIDELKDGEGGANADWFRKAPLPQNGNFADLNQGAGWDGDGGAELVSGDAGGNPMLWTLKAGTYTVRMFQREDGIGLDAFVLQLARYGPPAQNIPESPVDDGRPSALVFAPVPAEGASAAAYDSAVGGVFVNGTTTLDEASVKLTVDGAQVTPKTTKDGGVIFVEYQPGSIFAPGSQHSATIEYKNNTGATTSKSWNFTVARYALVPAAWAVTPNTGQPGFVWNIFQNAANQDNTIKRIEDTLAGALFGADGQLLPNQADASAQGNAKGPGKPLSAAPSALIQFEIEDVINLSQSADENNGAFTPDLQMPGIPGVEGSTDGIAAEALTFITLPAGRVRMGVNSDDGFRTTVSAGDPRDKFSLILGQFDGGRGASDTIFDFVVEKAGTYAFRTAWQEGGGGANIEWFILNAAGAKSLINGDGGPKSYRSASGAAAPIAKTVIPAGGDNNAAADTDVIVELADSANSKVDEKSVKMKFDGADVKPTVTRSGETTRIVYPNPGLFPPNSQHNVELTFNHGTPAQTLTRAFSFTVANYTTLPVAIGTKLGSGQTRGFKIRTFQSADGLSNDDNRGENQIAGTVGGANVANPKTSVETDVVNYNQDAPGAVGNFSAGNGFEDKPIPGIPGDTGSTDNLTQEIIAFVEFAKPGIYRMGVNSDDGFKVTPATQRDANAPILGIFNGGRGAADTIFSFNVAVAGVYPLRLIWYEGGGGANVEWFLVDKVGTKVLLNDSKNEAVGLKAFQARDESQKLDVPPVGGKITSVKLAGGNIVIEYTGTLESAPDVTGPWKATGGSSPLSEAISGAQRFYRTR